MVVAGRRPITLWIRASSTVTRLLHDTSESWSRPERWPSMCGRLDQQVGRLARPCEVRRDLGQDRGRHPRIVGIVLHDETGAPLAARSGGKRVERQHDIATVHGRCFSYSS